MVEMVVVHLVPDLILLLLAQGISLSVIVLAQTIFNYVLEMELIRLAPQHTAVQEEFFIIGLFHKNTILDLSNTEVVIGQTLLLLPLILDLNLPNLVEMVVLIIIYKYLKIIELSASLEEQGLLSISLDFGLQRQSFHLMDSLTSMS